MCIGRRNRGICWNRSRSDLTRSSGCGGSDRDEVPGSGCVRRCGGRGERIGRDECLSGHERSDHLFSECGGGLQIGDCQIYNVKRFDCDG